MNGHDWMRIGDGGETLSREGAARKREILADVQRRAARAQARTRTVRRAVGIGAGVAVLGVVVGVAWRVWPDGGVGTRGAQVNVAVEKPGGTRVVRENETAPAERPPGVAALSHINVVVVETDPSIVARYSAAATEHSAATWIGDDELLDLLARAGRPAGMIRSEGRTMLVSSTAMGTRSPGTGG
ncbi:MAG: hypothetical protein KF745_13030 [Phycisphaeraceae bacterium]|nr:hypothetical protein [Phycisphaeraceae bacterium]